MSLVYWKDRTLYVNPTNRCTCNCVFCIRNFSDGVFGFNLRLERDPTPDELGQAVSSALTRGFDEVAIVGLGEPTLNLDAVLNVVRVVKEGAGIPVRMDTNGHGLLIHPRRNVPRELAESGLDRVHVSLNAQDAATYVRLCRPRFGKRAYTSMLEFARRCSELMKVGLSVVDVPGVDIEACRRIAGEMGVDFRVRKFIGPDEVISQITETML